MWQKLIYLGLAGAAGTISRYLFSGFIQKLSSTSFPLGTAAVNIVGCLLFGIFWAVMENRLSNIDAIRPIIFIGFFGAFTTFSSFMYETSQLLDNSQWFFASVNIIGQNIIGLISILVGLAIGRLI